MQEICHMSAKNTEIYAIMKGNQASSCKDNLARTFLMNNQSVILLDEGIRPNLSEMVVEHTGGELKGEIKKGDKLSLGSSEYTVVAVGEDVNQNLKEEGHCTLVFNAEGSMPGQVILKGKGQPILSNGLKITFYKK